MKYCQKCGTELIDVVCLKCGHKQNYMNGFAIAGFVCSFLSPILGLIFGIIGIKQSEKNFGKGKGLGIASLVILAINFVLGVILFTVFRK